MSGIDNARVLRYNKVGGLFGDRNPYKYSMNYDRTPKCRPRKFCNKRLERRNKHAWAMRITCLTFALAIACSVLAQLATGNGDTAVTVLLLVFMILVSILFDGIGVSAASCDLDELRAQKDRLKPQVYERAMRMARNAEKVNNLCSDVVGDMCGILSGACGLTISLQLAADGVNGYWASVLVSSLIAALTVGGKAFMKGYAVGNACEFVLCAARMTEIFRIGGSGSRAKRKGKAKHVGKH